MPYSNADVMVCATKLEKILNLIWTKKNPDFKIESFEKSKVFWK